MDIAGSTYPTRLIDPDFARQFKCAILTVMVFTPNLSTLPTAQRALWRELEATPDHFTLYGGTALALYLGHRTSVDFDFFSNASFDPDELAKSVAYLKDAERIQVAPNTLTCRVDRGDPVIVSFFGDLNFGQVAPREQMAGMKIYVASLLDIAGTKAAVVQKRAEVKDYLDIDALLLHGIDLPTILAAGAVVYGRQFNPLVTVKALSYFDDLRGLPAEVRIRLAAAVAAVDVTQSPTLTAYSKRRGE